MDERLHSMFRNEMSAQARPSLDGMAGEVLARGRQARRARTAKIASIAVAAASLVGVAVAVPAIAGSQSAGTSRGASASPAPYHTPDGRISGSTNTGPEAVLLSAPSPVRYIPQPAGPKAPTTAGAILEELLRLLPPGATSNYSDFNNGPNDMGAQTYLAGASGVGMIRIRLMGNVSVNPEACGGTLRSDMTVTCGRLAGGAPVAVSRISDNCIQSASIDVDHGLGTVVQIDLSTCLAWNGTSNPPSPMAITVTQAAQIAANPAWGTLTMDAGLVQDAAGRFANVPAEG